VVALPTLQKLVQPMSQEETGFPANPFGGENCPACGVKKTTREEPFCELCLILLPPDTRREVTNRTTSIDTFNLILRSIVRFNAKGDGGVPDKGDKE
jgi:hypothetical protein